MAWLYPFAMDSFTKHLSVATVWRPADMRRYWSVTGCVLFYFHPTIGSPPIGKWRTCFSPAGRRMFLPLAEIGLISFSGESSCSAVALSNSPQVYLLKEKRGGFGPCGLHQFHSMQLWGCFLSNMLSPRKYM